MSGLFAGTKWERPVTCERCGLARELCKCPRSATGKVLVPGQQQPRVRREKRGGGKVVTIITGLDSVATDLPDLLKQLKSKCAAGGTLDAGELLIQGDHRDKLVKLLCEMGYAAKAAGG